MRLSLTGGILFVCLLFLVFVCEHFRLFFRAIQPPSMDIIIYARTGLLACDGLVIDKATDCSENSIFYC